MQTYDLQFGNNLIQMPWWWPDAMLIWLGLMGLILFLFGRRLVRPMFGVVGLVVGGLGGLTLARMMFPDTSIMPFVIIGAILGAVIAFALYRLGMGFVLALIFGVTAVVALMIMQGQDGPPIDKPIAAAYHQILDTVATASKQNAEADAKAEAAGDKDHTAIKLDAAALAHSLEDPIEKGLKDTGQAVADWWNAMSVSQRALLVTIGGGAWLLGFVLGVIFPPITAALVTAGIGSLMMIGGIGRLLAGYLSMDIMPETVRNLALMLVIMTIIGALIQWTIFKPRADK